MTGMEKWQFENVYIFNSKGDNLRILQTQTSLVMSDYKIP